MIFFIILLFPILEIYLTILFVQQYSFLDFIFAIITSGLMGYWVMTFVGKDAMVKLQTGLMTGNSSLSKTAIHKGVMALGGLMLFIPGLLSDIIAVFLILPGTRHLLVWYLQNKFKNGIGRGFNFKTGPAGMSGFKVYTSSSFKTDGFTNFQETTVEKDVTNSLDSKEISDSNVIQLNSRIKKD